MALGKPLQTEINAEVHGYHGKLENIFRILSEWVGLGH